MIQDNTVQSEFFWKDEEHRLESVSDVKCVLLYVS
jgi:hypothetical protein